MANPVRPFPFGVFVTVGGNCAGLRFRSAPLFSAGLPENNVVAGKEAEVFHQFMCPQTMLRACAPFAGLVGLLVSTVAFAKNCPAHRAILTHQDDGRKLEIFAQAYGGKTSKVKMDGHTIVVNSWYIIYKGRINGRDYFLGHLPQTGATGITISDDKMPSVPVKLRWGSPPASRGLSTDAEEAFSGPPCGRRSFGGLLEPHGLP